VFAFRDRLVKRLALALCLLLPGTLIAETVKVPFGTRVFLQLDQRVTSKKKHNRPGSFVQAHVYRDVVVNKKTIVKAGTPAMVQIGMIKGAKVAGIKGYVELKALQVTAVDGGDLMLTGGYDQSGKSLMALSIALAAIVFVPLIFLKGKQAKLEPGMVFDAMVSQPTEIEVGGSPTATAQIESPKPLTVTVLYEELEGTPDKDIKTLPMLLAIDEANLTSAQVIEVNGTPIDPIPITVIEGILDDKGNQSYRGEVILKALGKHFTRGFNRFTVKVGDATDEVTLDIEL
jgi:hypothetical protein